MLNREIIIRRLSLIKYLYRMGIQQSMQAETVAGFSILAFHDCVEMFLLLVAEYHNIKSDNLKFMEYWDKFPDLTQKESMRAMKDRRVSVKHKGQFPSKTDIEISRINVSDFLKENSKIQFDIDFEEISLFDLIIYDDVRESIRKAEEEMAKGNYDESLSDSAIAFEQLLHAYETSKGGLRYDNILDIGKKVNEKYTSLVGSGSRDSEWFKLITQTTNKLREVLKITAMGIDYKRYALFRFITPEVYYSMGENYVCLRKSSEKGIKVNQESCQICLDFVLDSSIKLQEFDFDINQYLNN